MKKNLLLITAVLLCWSKPLWAIAASPGLPATTTTLSTGNMLEAETISMHPDVRKLIKDFISIAPGAKLLDFMNKPLIREDSISSSGTQKSEGIEGAKELFASYNEEIRNKNTYICTRNEKDEEVCTAYEDTDENVRRREKANDNPKDLVWNGRVESGSKKYIDNLDVMDQEGLFIGKVKEQPWSGDYWALYRGALAFRYEDKSFPRKWHKAVEYLRKNSVEYLRRNSVDSSLTEEEMSKLSPAEKYDLVVGDESFTLSNSQVMAARDYAYDGNRERDVETWMGLCHGWAPASYMSKRPKYSVKAKTPSEKYVTFYPDDIKALSTLKWASGRSIVVKNGVPSPAQVLIGGRCNSSENDEGIAFDKETGAVIDDDCFNTNPGTWHKSVVNQVGIVKAPLIIDATFDYEVWNQPLLNYHYNYFNPMTGDVEDNLENAKVLFNKFENDKFRKHRRKRSGSKKIKYLVGIAMQVSYIGETVSVARNIDSEEHDHVVTVQYIYDLELTRDGEIVGGEWHTNLHPDFLWTPKKNAFAWNSEDSYDSDSKYEPGQGMNSTRRALAKEAANSGVVLRSIVDGLINASQNRNTR